MRSIIAAVFAALVIASLPVKADYNGAHLLSVGTAGSTMLTAIAIGGVPILVGKYFERKWAWENAERQVNNRKRFDPSLRALMRTGAAASRRGFEG